MRIGALAVLLASGASGCATAQRLDPAACDAGKVAGMVGRPLTVADGARATRLAGARTLRMIGPGQAVTMDYRADRLNARLDEKGVVTAFDCG